MTKYETTIGLEVHVHLLTKSKMFCGCSIKFGGPPNTQTCPVCLGFPGVLPVVNKEALNLAIKTALALNCEIAKTMKFDRKNYFYPDLPKNFQISQFDLPLASDGNISITLEGEEPKKIKIKRVHLEEDAAKSFHEKDSSFVDFNRGGTPLLEIVSEPDIASPEEAYRYLNSLKSILLYLGVSNCNMEEGSLRCDANVSIKPKGAKELGVKVELKNMNSFRWIRKGLQYEVDRQIKCLDEGDKIAQETRLWDEKKERTLLMRSKEESHDYRYFPEPDLLPFNLSRDLVAKIKESLPELPDQRCERLKKDYNISEYDASRLTGQKEFADYFEECTKLYNNPKILTNWIMGDISSELNRRSVGINNLGLKPDDLAALLGLLEKGIISGKTAKDVLVEIIDTKKSPEKIIKEKNLVQIESKDELSDAIAKVIELNPKSVEDYKKGKVNAIMFLVGQVMRETKGKANPKLVNGLLKEKLDKI